MRPLAARHRRALGAVGLVAAALVFRIAVVSSWHASAGDGLQYYALSQSLLRDGRLAFAPPPAPPQLSRVPGYPLFLAAVVHQAPVPLETHLRRATVANALLDLGSAALVFLLLRRRGHGLSAAWAGFFAVVACPILWFLSCYGLAESLATFLTTLTLYLALRGGWRAALGAGAAFGALQLVRVDGVLVLPAVGLAFLLGTPSWKARLQQGAAFALAAAIVFAPWPARNLRLFGRPLPFGTEWMRQDGTPLPLGMMRWMKTWGTGAPGEDYNLMAIANNWPVDVRRPGIILPVMYDDAAERAAVVAVFERYNRERMSPAVDAEFSRLADERAHRHPLRQYVGLPFLRLVEEWKPMPPWELPMKARAFGLPAGRVVWAQFERLLLLLSVVGAALLWRRDRTLAAVALAAVATTSLLHAYLHPFPVERYLVEAFPLLLALGGVGAVATARALATATGRLRGRVPAGERA